MVALSIARCDLEEPSCAVPWQRHASVHRKRDSAGSSHWQTLITESPCLFIYLSIFYSIYNCISNNICRIALSLRLKLASRTVGIIIHSATLKSIQPASK